MSEFISLLEQRIINAFPQYDESQIRFIEEYQGEMNKVYFFYVGDERVIIKKQDVKGFWNNLKREYHMLKGLVNCNVECPRPYFFDESFQLGPILCLEYVPGKILPNSRCKSYLPEIATLARNLHYALVDPKRFRPEDLKSHKTHFDMVRELLDYVNLRLEGLQQLEAPNKIMSRAKEIHSRLIKNILEERDAFCGTNFSFSHGDFKAQNLVFQAGRIPRLIDWEHANINDPAFEVEIFLKNTRLTELEIEGFLSVYGCPDERFFDRLRAYGSFFVLPSLLWHMDRVYNPHYNFNDERLNKYKAEMMRLIEEEV